MSVPTPQPIVEWLEKLGLGQYGQRFVEHEITLSILPDLTDADLKELGVSALGHRRLLLRAIAELDGVEKRTPTDATAATATVIPEQRDSAERRQVTVMFSDLVGSTALAGRMDPEDLREVISAYQKCVAETVGRFGGFVAKYMGDGVLVYFGYPQAHEDDAERAVRAGLGLVTAVSALKTPASLQTRVGIATGLVVVGDLIGMGSAQEQAVVGETPNLAARLQGIAEPNTVVIAESTRKLLGNLFDLEDLGAKDLKGIAESVRAWAALRPSSAESRFEALHATGLTALVGREEELEQLLRRWSKSKTGEGQVVLLSGESGIGKSRLTAALMERLAGEPQTRLRYFCSPQHTDSALYPVTGQMERAAEFAHGNTAQAKLDKLDALLAAALDVLGESPCGPRPAGRRLAMHWRADDYDGNNKGDMDKGGVYRVAGEVALKSPERDAAKAQAYFDSALAVARQQQAKSWELRTAMSMARLWRDSGKRKEARDLLAPVYGWFTEGFDTLDLKEAKNLLEQLA